uniref:Immunoglobulin domain-containing protein n=1 Tax=Terrapene triunguis TaxID=2587831 RepID=A0A674J456_9SAUR
MRRELLLPLVGGESPGPIVSLGVFAAAVQDLRYQITHPVSLSAPAGGSVTLPCSFTYPREIEPLRDGFTHPDYGGRIVLVGDPQGNRTASIRIDRLRESDASEYVCHVRVQKNDGTWEQWRRHVGTHLTVTDKPPSLCLAESQGVSAVSQWVSCVVMVLNGPSSKLGRADAKLSGVCHGVKMVKSPLLDLGHPLNRCLCPQQLGISPLHLTPPRRRRVVSIHSKAPPK